MISVGVDDEDSKRIVVELACVPNAEEYSMAIQIMLSSDDILTATLFAIKNEFGIFISPISEEAACRDYLSYARENELITEEVYES